MKLPADERYDVVIYTRGGEDIGLLVLDPSASDVAGKLSPAQQNALMATVSLCAPERVNPGNSIGLCFRTYHLSPQEYHAVVSQVVT